MKEFSGKIAVVTGGGTGMGRELVCQLVEEGADVAMCDVSDDNMQETKALAQAKGEGRVLSFVCDVSNESAVQDFQRYVAKEFDTDHINILFNNAGIAGGGAFVNMVRTEWDRCFDVCFYGVFYGCDAFMPMLLASDEGYIVNTSSVNGFWASVGPDVSHTAYSAAKFAVKGFTEALITDLRLNAPHVKCSVVMPGHIGTSIALNTSQVHGKGGAMDMSSEEVAFMRSRYSEAGLPVDNLPDDDIRKMVLQVQEDFRDKAPTSASQAAKIILDGVREERWRILVGDDAYVLDEIVREAPEEAYEPSLGEKMRERGHFKLINRDLTEEK